MATGTGGAASPGGGSPSTTAAASKATSATPGPDTSARTTRKADDVEVLTKDGRSQGVFNDGKPSAPNGSFEPPRSAGIRLESWGDGTATAELDPKSHGVVIRRSGRIVARLENPNAIADFALRRRLSRSDREILNGLDALRELEPQARSEARRRLEEQVAARQAERINVLAVETAKGRVREEVERNDAAVFARIEALRKARRTRPVEPLEPIAPVIAATRGNAETQAEPSRSKARGRVIPPDIARLYPQVGDRYLYPNNTKVVAFVDHGDRLETPSSAPQIARSLVAIAEARSWEELRVKGSDAFRREVWLEASSRGIHVDGYRPSEFDTAELERRHALVPRSNAVEKRSETLKSARPEEGVRRDPSLAGAYGVVRHAELVAQARVHPESRAGFIDAARDKVGEQLDAGKRLEAKLRILSGQLVAHGPAPYNFDPEEKPSYYVTLRDGSGRERVQWGAGLQKAMQSVDAQSGDTIQLRVTESKGLVIEGHIRDGEGRIIGRKAFDAHRNEWRAVVITRERAPERQVEPQRAR